MGMDLWKLGMNMRNPGGLRSNSFLNPLQNSFSTGNMWSSNLKLPGKRPDKSAKKRADKSTETSTDTGTETSSDASTDTGSSWERDAEAVEELYEDQMEEGLEAFEEEETKKGSKVPEILTREQKPSLDLQEAVAWAEILGEPAYRKHRKKRMGQLYGNQSYAGRR